ncbi:MAG: hypothetical protein RQ783_00700 [Gammaproteobacteria bacterium]|nr:hypothetical protein [Gammaproteobacteria bacterium]
MPVNGITLSDMTDVYNAVQSHQIQTYFQANSDLVDLYVPFLQGDIVGAVFGISYSWHFIRTNK